MDKQKIVIRAWGVIVMGLLCGGIAYAEKPALDVEKFRPYVEKFNLQDEDLYPQYIRNTNAWEFLSKNIPLFECPDKQLELTYYFRWWTYRKHIKKTPEGFVITEFLPPVGWAGKYNTVNFTACQHYMEGRWLADQQYLDAYARFWYRQGGVLNGPRAYTCWQAYALWQRAMVTGNFKALDEYLDDMVKNYQTWEKGWTQGGVPFRRGRSPNGLFAELDDREGTEKSIGGALGGRFRPLINSAMYGEAKAIAELARRSNRAELAKEYESKAAELKALVQSRLWNAKNEFYEVVKEDGQTPVGVREIWGYTPWYFRLPDPGREVAWKQLTDPKGFAAPYGPTSAEQRHPKFDIAYQGHECQWNGPTWPMMTSIILVGLANTLNDYNQTAVDKRAFHDTLMAYARSHRRVREDGMVVPWIDENLNPYTGDWIARTLLKERGWRIKERGKDYNHSTFCDLVISGTAGLRPRTDDVVEVNPLVPDGMWDYFCMDRIPYHGRMLTIIWDKTGKRYGKGAGLQVLVDGKAVARSTKLERVTGKM